MVSNLLKEIRTEEREIYGWKFWCPGCKTFHIITKAWRFNWNLSSPTFSPSYLVHADEKWKENTQGKRGLRCHLFISSGKIRFCGDCEHELKGQIVPMKNIVNFPKTLKK